MGIKGCARRMVVLNGVSGGVFETAYFIIKSDAESVSRGDMMREANRIIEENCFSQKRKKRGRVLPFVFGTLVGGGTVGLVWLLCRVLLRF